MARILAMAATVRVKNVAGGLSVTRYARRTDLNQAEIVKALRKAGAIVKVIHQPYDLQVWGSQYTTKSIYMECKNPKTGYGKKGLNPKQAEEARGMPVAMVDSVDAALRALAVLRNSK